MGQETMQTVKMRINAFRGDDEVELGFPGDWKVTECRMAGHDRPALSTEEMRAALQNPIGSPRLRDLAKGKKQAVILFDDIAKPTPAGLIATFVLEELHAGGIGDEQIRFLSAPGTHRSPTHRDFVAKLGREIVEKYPVYNHNIWENLVDVGKTSRGTPVQVNREFASCDLRVAIGGILPHGNAGFGGGGKIVLPGVCGIDTVDYHHRNMLQNNAQGRVEDNVFRLDIEEAARLAGLHFKVDAVLNNRREVVGLFAGDVVAEHRAGSKLAAQVYRTVTARDADIVVANSYPDEVQLIRVMWCLAASLRQGGDMVVLSHAPDGQCFVQLRDRRGTDFGGRHFKPGLMAKKQEKAGRVFIVAPFLSRADRDEVGDPAKVVHCRSWEEAMEKLAAAHGPGTKVAVYPCGAAQMPDADARWLLG